MYIRSCVDWCKFDRVNVKRKTNSSYLHQDIKQFVQEHEFENIVHFVLTLTYWGWGTHICVGNLTIIGSDDGLALSRRQAIIWTNAGIVLIGPLGTNFSETLTEIGAFSFKKMHFKMSSAKGHHFVMASVLICQRGFTVTSTIATENEKQSFSSHKYVFSIFIKRSCWFKKVINSFQVTIFCLQYNIPVVNS